MAANFWELQRKARSRTKAYLTAFVVMTLGVAVGCELVMQHLVDPNYANGVPMVGLVFVGVTFAVAGFQYLAYRSQGGAYVAESLGGRLVGPDATNFKEQQLYNITEEIALASGIPTPPVYIIEAKQINAFAAGLTRDKAAIAMTRGALEMLDREEIQGVVAHEFGHIYNGDMKISLHLAAMLMGFFFIMYLALRTLHGAAFIGGGRRSNQKGGNPVIVAVLILVVAGAVTWFFGALLRAMVSRQREYLADACAIQFTRNPEGIANALRKIGGLHVKNDMPKEGMAYTHMYFDHHQAFGGWFATHPPLKKRISAIEGRTYMPDEWKQDVD